MHTMIQSMYKQGELLKRRKDIDLTFGFVVFEQPVTRKRIATQAPVFPLDHVIAI
jgi:hypothetical protein